jgi:hypothetical protein
MPSEVFRATVPKTDPPFPVHDVNPHRQVFHHMPEELRVIEEVRRHTLAAPPSSFIGSQGRELQGPEGQCSALCLSHTVCRVPVILDIGMVGADRQAPSWRVLQDGNQRPKRLLNLLGLEFGLEHGMAQIPRR